MKRLASLLLCLPLLAALAAPPPATGETDKELTRQIATVLNECKKLTPGTTRAELLKVFKTEGGLANATHRTLVYRRCPYIKVDVDLALTEPDQSRSDERPTDKLTRMSRPYLEWSIAD